MLTCDFHFTGHETPAGREWVVNAVETMEERFGDRFRYEGMAVKARDYDALTIWFKLDGFE